MLTRWEVGTAYIFKRIAVFLISKITVQVSSCNWIAVMANGSDKMQSRMGLAFQDNPWYRNLSYEVIDGRFYGLPPDKGFQISIHVTRNFARGGHHDGGSTVPEIKDWITWPTMELDVYTFVQSRVYFRKVHANGSKKWSSLESQIPESKQMEIARSGSLNVFEHQ